MKQTHQGLSEGQDVDNSICGIYIMGAFPGCWSLRDMVPEAGSNPNTESRNYRAAMYPSKRALGACLQEQEEEKKGCGLEIGQAHSA